MAGILRLVLAAVLLALIAKAIERFRRSAEPAPTPEWPSWSERRPGPAAPGEHGDVPPAASSAASNDSPDTDRTWAAPDGDDCPPGFPVKVKIASGIYHVEGMLNYERTHPDRCYRSADAAEADGYRASKV